MRRCLIIGNQTLMGGDLQEAVQDRIGRGIGAFYVVVPMTKLEHEAAGWNSGLLDDEDAPFPPGEFGAMLDQQRAMRDAARERAGRRLDGLLELIRSTGGDAEGELGDPDPLAAVRAVLAREDPFEEIIVSTLPSRLSRWLRMDLPSRIARATGIPVTPVEAEPDDRDAPPDEPDPDGP